MTSEIQKIMEAEGATEVEARVLYHLQEAFRAWLEIESQNSEEPQEKGLSRTAIQISRTLRRERYRDHHLALRNTILSRIHRREHPLEE